jgi:hypothetical protein
LVHPFDRVRLAFVTMTKYQGPLSITISEYRNRNAGQLPQPACR